MSIALNFIRSTALLAVLFVLSFQASAQSDESRIRKVLLAQQEQWNRGNIEGYMVGYWENDSLVFIGKDGPTYGYASTLARYRKAYPDTVAMGKLRFNILSIRMLSPEYAFVTGLWNLTRQNGPKSGAFTLLFRKIKSSWVIVNDHSS
jgi:hypothetical protein